MTLTVHHRIKNSIKLLGFCFSVVALTSCIYTTEIKPRPKNWAQPIVSEALPNLHQVSPDLYRCGLPDDEDFKGARTLGIRTVVNLRPGKNAQKHLGRTAPAYVNIPVRTSKPTYEQARQFFKILDSPERTPVLLHCYHGADRTGAFTALYRINRQGWSKEEAIREMTGGGFHFHRMWESLVGWVRDAPEF